MGGGAYAEGAETREAGPRLSAPVLGTPVLGHLVSCQGHLTDNAFASSDETGLRMWAAMLSVAQRGSVTLSLLSRACVGDP